MKKERKLSLSGHIWRAAMDRPYVVRGTVGLTSNELVGSYVTYDDALAVAQTIRDAKILHKISGELLWPKED